VLTLDEAEPFDEIRREFAVGQVTRGTPEPDGPLRDCTDAIYARFPDWPPYEGPLRK
jgi:hypothetical protein